MLFLQTILLILRLPDSEKSFHWTLRATGEIATIAVQELKDCTRIAGLYITRIARLYKDCRIVQGLQDFTRIAGFYMDCRIVQELQDCTRIAGLYKDCRIVQELQDCTRIAGLCKDCKIVQGLQDCQKLILPLEV